MLLSSAPDTTQGRPQASAIRSARRTPPSAATVNTAISAEAASGRRSGSEASRMDWSTATGMSIRPRSADTSASVRHGCSTNSSPPAARSKAGMTAAAVSRSQFPLASQRIAPAGPSASRTTSSRAMSVASVPSGSPTRTAAVRQPASVTIRRARSGSTAGTVTATGTRPRMGSGQPTVPASMDAVSQRPARSSSQPGGALNSPQPCGPSISIPS